jgi:TonB family protein
MNEFGLQWVGQIIDGRIALSAYLGGSENTCVYATQLNGRQAAIKLIRADRAQAKDHLLRWSRATGVAHPSLAQMFETGWCGIGATDLVYVVMERADETLAEILPRRPLTPTEVRDMLGPILDALAYLHEKRFVHARLKPSNILAIGDYVKTSSDGISVIAELQSESSAYHAPEVASTGCSPAADVWSLGMVIVEALTQELPRGSASNQEGLIVPALMPQPFLGIARNCLWRDPRRRWTVADISTRLQAPPGTQAAQMEAPPPEVEAVKDETRPPIQPPKFQSTLGRSAARVRRPSSSLRFSQFVPGAVLIALAAVVVLVAPKILDRWQNHGGRAVVEAGPSLTSTPGPEGPLAAEPNKTPEAAPATNSSPESAFAPAPTRAENNSEEESQDEVVQRVMPNVSQSALRTITGTVRVAIRVQVAPSGDVRAADTYSAGPSKYFANQALKAANSWKFAPAATSNGNADRTWILRFEFRGDGTKVIPTVAPE